MPTERARLLLVSSLLVVAGCHRAPSGPAPVAADPAPVLSDPEKIVAFRDLQHDLADARRAIAEHKSPVYATERMQVAARALSDERDDNVLKLLGEAETVYGLEAPVTWAEEKMKAVEAAPDGGVKPADCAAIHEMLNRVDPKWSNRSDVLALVGKYKSLCPKMPRERRASYGGRSYGGGGYGGGGGGGGGTSASDRAAQRDACKQRCDHVHFECWSGCQYCGGCPTGTMTWDQCNSICNTCRDGCESNLKFCNAACGD